MTKQLLLCLLITAVSIFPKSAISALTQDPSLHWRTLYSDHFEIHFHDGEEALAQEVATISEHIHDKLTVKLNWEPQSRTQVILTDRFDYSNGQTYPIPHNQMRIIVSPPDSLSSLGDYDNWLELLIIHEYTHVLHLDKSSGLPKSLRNVFGRFLPLFPNLIQPPWLIEGIATYYETDSKNHTGRGQNSYFRMLMRMEVENGIKPLNQINQPLTSWPMNTSRYLYGVYFFNFIADRYGEDKIQELIENYSDNLLPFAINTNSNLVLGKSLDQLWEEFTEYLKNEFTPEINKIRNRGESSGHQLTQSGYFTATPKTTSNGDVYFIQTDMRSEPRLMALKKGEKKPHTISNSRGRYFDIHPQSGIVVAELNNVRNTNIFSDLHHIDPVSGKKTQITKGGRYLYASWSPDGQKIIAVQNKLGEHALHLLDKQGKILDVLWQGKDKSVLGPPDWSPNSNQIVLSVWRPDTQWNLEIFDVATRQWKQLTHSQNIETTPQFTTDGRDIFFSADYNGVFNLRRLNLITGNITTLSNVIGGAFSPAPSTTNEIIYYVGAGGNGFDLFRLDTPLATSNQQINNNAATNTVKNPETTSDIPDKTYQVSDYDAIPLIVPTGWYPYFFANNERTDIGIVTWGSDPIKRHTYNLAIAYDAENKWFVGRLDYLYDRWEPTLKFSIDNQAVTYLDNNNIIERYRNLDTYTIEALWPIFSYEQQWVFHAGLIHEIESDKDILSNFGRLPTDKNDLLGIALSYNSTRRYPISISPSFGRQIRIVAENSDFLQSDNTGQIFTVDWRELVGLPNQHVLAARGVIGFGTDKPEYFRLGGTEETSVPPEPQYAAYAATQRIFGHRKFPLRGYPEGRADLSGRRIILAELEWRFPIIRVERGLMSPPIGLHQLHGKLFYNRGGTWINDNETLSPRSGAGVELNSELVLGYWLPTHVRMGYAKGFDTGGEEQAYMEVRVSF